MSKYVRGKETVRIICVNQRTLYQWGQVCMTLKGFLEKRSIKSCLKLIDSQPKLKIAYIRVSSIAQKR